ncbi:cytochrome P450 [Streptomyces sp. NPDC050560]|uniref:cytochrome P450 n=1 Tax=Streptomyces sp. NPDC050560 TaxID=3365630 RepID=UPI00379D2243
MTETLGIHGPETAPAFPMKRASGCPFDPPPELTEQQRRGPLTRVDIGEGRIAWLITGYEDQRKLLSDPRVSADFTKPGYPSPVKRTSQTSSVGFILMDDPEHARQRRMVTAPFAVKRIAAMRPRVQEIVDGLIDELLAGPRPVDLVQAFALPVPSLVICELLGVPYADHDFFQANSKVVINRETSADERDAAFARLGDYLRDLVGEKQRAPGDDLLSELAERVDAGSLTREEAAGIGVLLLIAGHETTANMIALGTLALLEHPDQLAALRDSDDPALVSSAVEELLRYLSIVHSGRRRAAVEDIEFAGQTIRAGDGLIFPTDIGNRDPSVFSEPDTLDVTRDARRHVAFGFGVHQCLGQTLARMELQVVYSTLYRRIPALRLAASVEDIPFKHDGAVYGVYELPVTW